MHVLLEVPPMACKLAAFLAWRYRQAQSRMPYPLPSISHNLSGPLCRRARCVMLTAHATTLTIHTTLRPPCISFLGGHLLCCAFLVLMHALFVSAVSAHLQPDITPILLCVCSLARE